MNDQKQIFIVLGMARSGTSAVTRGLQALGVDLGEELTPANHKWNPTGFWEDHEIIYKINNRIFNILNFQPYGIMGIDPQIQNSDQLDAVRKDAIDLLNKRFASTTQWGFKDPSAVKVLAFWQTIFTQCHLHDNYIIALRHPLSVAKSYQALTGLECEVGLLLWLMHMLQALDGTQNHTRIVVSYELLLKNPIKELTRMQRNLSILNQTNTTLMDTFAQQFLDKSLQHFMHDDRQLTNNPAIAVVPLCVPLYQLLQQLAQDRISFQDPQFQSELNSIKNSLNATYPLYVYIDELLKRNKNLSTSLKMIHKSLLWKMLYPLRFIDDLLRTRRHSSRLKRRLSKAYG